MSAVRRAAVLAGLLLASPAIAAETGGCGRFAWPVAADIALLADAKAARSGDLLDVASPAAVRLTLVPAADAKFEIPPERTPATTAPVGVLRFEARAGRYQVTLADPAWIDLVQNGRALKPSAFSGVADCEGARKTMRFLLGAGPVTLQISDARTRTLGIAISPAP